MADQDPLLRTIVVVIAIILLVPLLMMIVMWPMMGMWGGGHMWDWTGTAGFGWVMVVMWALPLAILVVAGFLVYRGLARTGRGGGDAALEELRITYARGDISDDEFEKRRNRLRREE